MDGERPTDRDVGSPAEVVGPRRLDPVPAVDEHERRGRRPVPRDGRRGTDDADDDVLHPGIVDRRPERRQGVHLADPRVDHGGVVPLPAGLVLLGPAVVVDGEHDGARGPGRGAEPDRRAAAVGPDLDDRGTRDGSRGGDGGGVQGVALVGRHEALGRQRVGPPVVVHPRQATGRVPGGGAGPQWRRASGARRTRHPPRPGADRGQHLPWALARREPPARVRRPGRRAGPRRRGAHRRRFDTARPLAARVLPAARRPVGPDPVRGGPAARRPQLHDPPRRGHPARQGDLQPPGELPHARVRPRSPAGDAARRAGTRDVARLAHADGAVQGPDRRVVRPAPADRRALCRRRPVQPQGHTDRRAARLAAGGRRRCPTTRSSTHAS